MRPTSHVHAHAPHELSEPPEAYVSRRERILELRAVLLLSASTLATALLLPEALRAGPRLLPPGGPAARAVIARAVNIFS